MNDGFDKMHSECCYNVLDLCIIEFLNFYNKVGTVLLSCAFLYDIFWVFVSKWWFRESVMIVVSKSEFFSFGFCNPK